MRVVVLVVLMNFAQSIAGQGVVNNRVIDMVDDTLPVVYHLTAVRERTVPTPLQVESRDGFSYSDDPENSNPQMPPEFNSYSSVRYVFANFSLQVVFKTRYENTIDTNGTSHVQVEIENRTAAPMRVDFGRFEIIKDGTSLRLGMGPHSVPHVVPPMAKVSQDFYFLDKIDELVRVLGQREIWSGSNEGASLSQHLGPHNGFGIFIPVVTDPSEAPYFDGYVFSSGYKVIKSKA